MSDTANIPLEINMDPTIDEYQMIWENTNDAIIILRKDGAIIQSNPALTNILGWNLKEVEGIPRPPLFTDDFTLEDHQKLLDILTSGESILYFETKRKHKDGTVKDILASYRAINKKNVLAVAMYKDITKEKKMQHKLGVTESCYRTLVEYSPDAILVQNDGELSFANPEAVKLLGAKDVHQIIGKSIFDFIEANNIEENSNFVRIFKHLEMLETRPMIEKFVRFDGTKIWVEIIAIPVMYDGETVIQAILRDVTVRKYYEDQLAYMATHDPMTGVVNRSSFILALDKTIKNATELEETFAVLYLDLDEFKGINDTFGHGVGDELLIQFANRMKENVRDRDVVGRIGGDEFLVLLQDVDEKKIESTVKRMLHHFGQPYRIKGEEIVSTSSIGIALFPTDGDNSKKLMHSADQALYKAKEKRNHFEYYNQ